MEIIIVLLLAVFTIANIFILNNLVHNFNQLRDDFYNFKKNSDENLNLENYDLTKIEGVKTGVYTFGDEKK
ncbi:MAG: hypothetical protein QXL94_00840 [Candidatus Parvarchaeum sp.]